MMEETPVKVNRKRIQIESDEDREMVD